MLLTDLPDVLRDGGCDVVVLDNFRTHHHGELQSVDAILWHHTAGAATGDRPSLPVVRYGRAGLPGPLAQLLLARSGTYYVVSAGVCWQAGRGTTSTADRYGLPLRQANWHSIGAEMESTGVGRSDWTPEQIEAQGKGGAALGAAYGVELGQQIAHAEWAPGRKIDPSRWPGGFDGLRSNIAKHAGGGGGAGGGGKAPTRHRLKVDGKWGRATTTDLQQALDAPFVDGEISRQNEHWRDDNPGLTTGFEWIDRDRAVAGGGSPTIERVQAMAGVRRADRDGLIGPQTIKALQRYLRKTAGYDGAVDGEVWKPSTTVKALQHALNEGNLA